MLSNKQIGLFDPQKSTEYLAPVSCFKRTFNSCAGKVRLQLSALGLYHARLDGKEVTDNCFTPGWCDYRIRAEYQTYEIQVTAGTHELEVLLADGWYAGIISDIGFQEPKRQALLFCSIELPDGKTVTADSSWQCSSDGPLLYSDIYMGEHCDLTRQWQNWHTPALAEKELDFEPFAGDPVRRTGTVLPVSVNGNIVDFGENLTGREQIVFSSPRGRVITIRHAEVLDENGRLYTENLRTAKAQSIIVAPGGECFYEPLFTFYGFRYIEVEGADSFEVKAVHIHSDMPLHLKFNCSNGLLNKLVDNIRRGWLCNAVDVPTDCPQRDERVGWLGDAQVFIKAALYLSDCTKFFRRWLKDVRLNCDERGWYGIIAPHLNRYPDCDITGWSDAGVICPWEVFRFSGDKQILAENYDSMLKFVTTRWQDFQAGKLPFSRFKDWLNGGQDTPAELLAAAFLCRSTFLVMETAKILEKSGDVKLLAGYLEAEKKYFNDNFADKLETQTALSLALVFDLLQPELREAAAGKLCRNIEERNMHLATGFLGTPYLLHALSDNGKAQTAWALLEQTTCPSWLFPVLNGATTIWERWDGWTPEKGFQTPTMNSFNHYAYGAVLDWIIGKAAGISPDFDIDPVPGGTLSFLEAEYRGIYVRWDKNADKIRYTVKVPADRSVRFRGSELAGGKTYYFTEHINLLQTKG